MSDIRFLRSIVGADSNSPERPLIFMTLAERRARRFAELVGGEVEAWDADTDYISWCIECECADVYYDNDQPYGELVLNHCVKSTLEVIRFIDILRQVLDELPDEWTEEDGGSRSDALAAMSHADTIRSGYVG